MANGEVLYLHAPKVYFCPQLGAKPALTIRQTAKEGAVIYKTPENGRETRQFSLQNEADRVSSARD